MASNIDPNDIDGSYPVAGQDNNSQGFRDNFTNIKTNFTYAGNEITDLQNKVVLKAALTGSTLDNNMNDALLYAAKIQDFSATKVSVAETSGSITVNYASGHYQAITTSGSISVSFSNFPPTGSYGYIKLQLNITNTAHTFTVAAGSSLLGTAGVQGYSAVSGASGTITFSSTGYYEFGFGTYDGGSTVTIFDLNRALTNFSGADLSIDDITASGTANITGNVNGGNLRTAGLVTATGNITGGNIISGGLVTITGNVTGGNLRTAGLVSATGNVTGGNVVGLVRPSGGNAAVAPLQFTSGTNLSTAAAGALEYDGVVLYGTPQAQQRGVLDASHFVCLVNSYTANDSSSAQKVFNSPTNGTVTLPATTSYFFEAVYYITRSLGSTSHTLSTLFAVSSALTACSYTADTTSTASNILGTVSRIYATGSGATVVTAASTATNENITVVLKGVIRTGSATTFIPQIQYSSAPGGAPTILAGSYFKLTPIGSDTVVSVGNWS